MSAQFLSDYRITVAPENQRHTADKVQSSCDRTNWKGAKSEPVKRALCQLLGNTESTRPIYLKIYQYHTLSDKFHFSNSQQAIPSGKDWPILPAWVADQNK